MDMAPVGNMAPAAAAVPATPSSTWLVENREMVRSIKGIDAPELFGEGSELTFGMDWETKRPVVRVVNSQKGEVLWQSPPEYMLRLAQSLASGLAAG
jgi:hypothetical protein